MHLLTRRRWLQGFGLGAGASFLGPLAAGLVREAHGQAPKKRFIVFAFANGLEPPRYGGTVRGEEDFDLAPALMPLSPYQKDLVILEKFNNSAGVNLHGNYGQVLTAKAGGPSIDRVVAAKLGIGDAWSSVNLNLFSRYDKPVNVSTDGGGKSYPGEWNPLRAHEKLFGGAATASGESAERLLARDRSVLDFLASDIAKLNQQLAGAERQKLDQYLESVRAFETQLVTTAKGRADCSVGGAPAVMSANDFKGTGDVKPEVVRALVDVGVNAQLCGLTHVTSFGFMGGFEPDHKYRFLNDSVGHHIHCHERNLPMLIKIDQFHFGEVAHLWKRLRETREGSGTMADNSLVMVVNSGGGRHHSGAGSHPIIILGSAGRSFRTGRFISTTGKSIGDVFTAACNAVGVPLQKWGDEKSVGPLPQLTQA